MNPRISFFSRFNLVFQNDGPWEVLHVHVSIVKKWTGKLYRTQLDYEFSSQTRVAELAKTLEAFK